MKEAIIINKFVLGRGKHGTYSDLEILIRKGDVPGLQFGGSIECEDKIVLNKIEELLKEWIRSYEELGVFLEIKILNVGVDEEGREYAVDNSVNGLMHDALPEIDVLPPRIFEF